MVLRPWKHAAEKWEKAAKDWQHTAEKWQHAAELWQRRFEESSTCTIYRAHVLGDGFCTPGCSHSEEEIAEFFARPEMRAAVEHLRSRLGPL